MHRYNRVDQLLSQGVYNLLRAWTDYWPAVFLKELVMHSGKYSFLLKFALRQWFPCFVYWVKDTIWDIKVNDDHISHYKCSVGLCSWEHVSGASRFYLSHSSWALNIYIRKQSTIGIKLLTTGGYKIETIILLQWAASHISHDKF